jgi:hypothetical protein
MFFCAMGYVISVLLADWSLYTCKEPINVWLLGTYLYLTSTHFLGVLSRQDHSIVESCSTFVYFFVFLPFSIVWTVLGTLWYAEAGRECLPKYEQGTGLLFILMISYLYAAIGLALLMIFSMMFFARQHALSEFSFIIVPNDDHRVDRLSQSLLEQLDRHSHSIDTPDLSCPICYEDMPVRHRQVGSSGLKLPCSHEMHLTCVREWFELKSSCPVCRADVAERLRD